MKCPGIHTRHEATDLEGWEGCPSRHLPRPSGDTRRTSPRPGWIALFPHTPNDYLRNELIFCLRSVLQGHRKPSERVEKSSGTAFYVSLSWPITKKSSCCRRAGSSTPSTVCKSRSTLGRSSSSRRRVRRLTPPWSSSGSSRWRSQRSWRRCGSPSTTMTPRRSGPVFVGRSHETPTARAAGDTAPHPDDF